MNRGRLVMLRALTVLIGLFVSAGAAAAQEAGTVQGTVVQALSGQAVPGAQVYIQGTHFGTVTNAAGRFQLLNVPNGTHTLNVRVIGYSDLSQQISVSGGVVTLNLELEQAPIALQEVVVTGVAGATPKAKLPFVVDQVRMADMPVPSVTAGGMLQGKVAGATIVSGSGLPGSAPSIMLRGPTSINAAGRSQEPLYIVDGVILGSGFIDFDALDIENIEIVKGAAAASLYGSRAANGVVQVTTKRGSGLAESQARFTVRSEYGRNQLPRTIEVAQYHPYKMNEAKTKFIGPDDKEYDYADLKDLVYSTWDSYSVNPWPGKTYDNVGDFFRAGDFGQHSVSLEGRSGGTNYFLSFSNMSESGVLREQEGFKRNNFRLNIDHGLFESVKVNASAFYSRSDRGQLPGNPLFALSMATPVINLGARDSLGRLNPWPDPLHSEELNPLYVVTHQKYGDKRDRFLGSGSFTYNPTSWLDAEAGVSFDRSTINRELFYPKGYSNNLDGTAGIRPLNPEGYLRLDNINETSFNAFATATLTKRFGELNTRMRLRYLYEEQDYNYFYATGTNFSVDGIPRLGTTQQNNRIISSHQEIIRSEGFYLISAFDYLDRYIFDAQVRRDGSSLFGENERWHTYYRLGGAWRISEEDFFNLPGVDEFKLRYAYGTAGSKPRFSAQYEVYSVSGGAPSPVTLGNKDIKPEFAAEHEMGLDVIFLNRFDFALTYANSTVTDQILPVPLPGYAGFSSQWVNAGTLKSNTLEMSLGGDVYRAGKFSWNSRVLFDRTRQEITDLSVPCHNYGLSTVQGFEAAFYACPGEAVGTFYGVRWATSMDELPKDADRSKFQINNDGYVVYVGQGNTWRDGKKEALWGKTFNEAGRDYKWGAPIRVLDEDGVDQVRLGKTMPDFNWSLANTFRFGGLSLYALVDASHGFNVYNRGRQWAIRDRMSPDMVQVGKPDDEQLPYGYYMELYATNNLSSHFVEDGSFIKLRELSLRYNIDRNILSRIGLAGLDRFALTLSGRNLKTWTDYQGYDPEVGFTGGEAASAVLNRIDAYQYPNYRTWTIGAEIGF